jgi:radical SAM protein with 4Fe4S-binding SPASM domain
MMGSLITKAAALGRALLSRRIVIKCDGLSYVFDKVPYRKILNWVIVEASCRLRPLVPWGRPTHAQIEPAGTCNLRCTLCPVTGQMKRKQGLMELATFRKFIDDVGDYLFLILLWDWGEPLLNPRLFEMVAYAKTKGIKLVTSTNAHLLTDRDLCRRLIESGLDTVIVAVDGLSQETYATYRRGGDLSVVFKGIRTLAEERSHLQSETPLINLRFIPMKHNEHEIAGLRKVGADLGVDIVTLKSLNPGAGCTYDGQPEAQDGQDSLECREPRLRRFKRDEKTGRPLRRKRNACKNLWNSPTIHFNGALCPCTYDFDEQFAMGNLNESGFMSIWKGEPYRRMRQAMRGGDPSCSFCHDCSYAFVGGNCIDETILDVFTVDKKAIESPIANAGVQA